MRSQPEDQGIARRANAILLRDDWNSRQTIAELLFLYYDTIYGSRKTYHEIGWDERAFNSWKGGQFFI